MDQAQALAALRDCRICMLQVACTETWLKVSKKEVAYFIGVHNEEYYVSTDADGVMYLSLVR
jgi:hypothetical protein